jgi:tetratricopeptide (TPR) repeat protein
VASVPGPDDRPVSAEQAVRLVMEGEALQPGAPAAAAQLFCRAAEVACAAGEVSMSVGAYEREVQAWAAAGDTRRARQAADRALASMGAVEDLDLRVALTTNVATALGSAGFDDAAIELLASAHAALKTRPSPDPNTEAAILLNIAVTETNRGHADAALARLTAAAATAERSANTQMLATIRLNEAVAFSALHEERRSRAAYIAALRLYREAGAEDADLASAIRGQAATLAKLGRYREALDLYHQAIMLFQRAGRPDEAFGTRIGELVTRNSLGTSITADELDELEGQLTGKPVEVVGQMSRNIGNVRLRFGDLDGAERAYLRARRAFRQLRRAADVASVDSNRALAARDRGDLERARRLLSRVRREQERLGNWLSVANADINLASLMEQIADQASPPRMPLLRAAARRSQQAAEAIDRYRHQLGTAADRAAVIRNVYGGMFMVGIRLALRCGATQQAAALIEHARVQPVLADPSADDRPFLPPMPVAATGRRREHNATVAVLADEAVRLGGPRARWLGWWLNPDVIVGAMTSPGGTTVFARTVEDELATLAAALPVPLPGEYTAAADDGTAQRAALYRALRGPLIRAPDTAALVASTLPGPVRSAAETAGGYDVSHLDDAALLWPVTRMLLPQPLRQELLEANRHGQRLPLIVAPPPELGRVPWAALPLEDPASTTDSIRLVEAADVTVALPISLSVSCGQRVARRAPEKPALLVVDPIGDLRHLRRLHLPGARRLGWDNEPATRGSVLRWAPESQLLALGAHVTPGNDLDPASSAILLAHPSRDLDPVTVADLARISVPPVCVLFTCDGAGAGVGNEWTGVATGLVWAGAEWVIATVSPTIEDRAAALLDQALLDEVSRSGPREGLWAWQRELARSRRQFADASNGPLRWAAAVVTGSPRQRP